MNHTPTKVSSKNGQKKITHSPQSLESPKYLPPPQIAKTHYPKPQETEVELLTHYNYRFVGDYQFSPSTTPLIHYHRTHFKNRGNPDLCSFFYLCWCLGNLKEKSGSGTWECQLEALPVPPNEEDAIGEEEDLFDSGDEESEPVDKRAERLIERFYQEMRMQRRESI